VLVKGGKRYSMTIYPDGTVEEKEELVHMYVCMCVC
jgi:hypothetical protein